MGCISNPAATEADRCTDQPAAAYLDLALDLLYLLLLYISPRPTDSTAGGSTGEARGSRSTVRIGSGGRGWPHPPASLTLPVDSNINRIFDI